MQVPSTGIGISMEMLTRPSRKQQIAVSAALLQLSKAQQWKVHAHFPLGLIDQCIRNTRSEHTQYQPFHRLFFMLLLNGDSKRTWKLHGVGMAF